MALRNDHHLSLKQQVAMIVVITMIIVVGILLYAAGYNESFYSESEQVRSVFEALTNLGTDALYLALLTLIYLSYDKRFGRRLCYVFFFMVYVTDFLKEFFQDPRPPANLERDDPYTSYGLPSGHTTTAITFYGYIMLSHLGDRRLRLPLIILCGFAIVVVPISRLVIGVHDLQDVVGGAVIALSILLAYMVFLPRAAPVVKAWTMERQIGVGVAVALLLWVIDGLILTARHSGELMVALEETAMGAGLLLGCAIAFPLEEAYVDYRPDTMSRKDRMIAGVIGLPITIAVYAVLAIVSDDILPGYAADMLTYSVLILVLGLLVPMILKRFVVACGSVPSKAGP